MKGERVSADDQEFNVVSDQRADELVEVWRQIH
jgi:hypothetical protein